MITLREIKIEDYDGMIALWQKTEGLGLSPADSRESIQRYLERNAGCSYIAIDTIRDVIAGTLLAGHDGRRGYLYHMAVDPDYRGQGIARQLTERSMNSLAANGIDRAHLFVLNNNEHGQQFWTASHWQKADHFSVFSKDTHG